MAKYTRERLLNLLKIYIDKNNSIPNVKRDFINANNLPSYTTYKNIFNKDYITILKMAGINLSAEQEHEILSRGGQNNKTMSKDEVIHLILEKQKALNRPLTYDDFRNPKINEIGITSIRKYWGTLNNMKKELNLVINQEDMTCKKRTYDECRLDIMNMCHKIFTEENRITVTTKDIKRLCPVNFWSYSKVFVENNSTLRDYIESIGFKYQKEGNGLNYFFIDGEKVRSQYELDFSKYLREGLCLEYKYGYRRDVKYKEFIPNYNGLLDCDYIINYNNRVIYIEIAGMLRDNKKNFINNIPITTSKSKEKYRLKLIEKEKMLKDNS